VITAEMFAELEEYRRAHPVAISGRGAPPQPRLVQVCGGLVPAGGILEALRSLVAERDAGGERFQSALEAIHSLRTRLQAAERERDEARSARFSGADEGSKWYARANEQLKLRELAESLLSAERAAHAETRRALEVERAVIAEIDSDVWPSSTMHRGTECADGTKIIAEARRRIAERAQKG
jgi:hypothetical protein